MRPQGYNLGWNLGRVAGAGVVDHVHEHVVPRWAGDTNFMPVLADVKVMPEALEETRAQARRRLAASRRRGAGRSRRPRRQGASAAAPGLRRRWATRTHRAPPRVAPRRAADCGCRARAPRRSRSRPRSTRRAPAIVAPPAAQPSACGAAAPTPVRRSVPSARALGRRSTAGSPTTRSRRRRPPSRRG